MAFQSNTLVNGQWTTRTIDVDTIMQHYDQREKANAAPQLATEQTPKFGILSQTVIRSPLAHWILPVRLRDSKLHDVAFVGDDFVQIKELRSDGLLWDVIRKDDFGSRIRNVTVVGTLSPGEADPHVRARSSMIKTSSSDDGEMDFNDFDFTSKPTSDTQRPLPPQFLVLQLETGESVFMMLQPDIHGHLDFITNLYRVSKAMLTLQAGIHIAVDPGSRYMAVGSSEGMVAIYELQHRTVLEKQFAEGKRKLNHVAKSTTVMILGSILKMVFLYPSQGCDDSVILLLLAVHKNKTRMVKFEWERGSDVREIATKDFRGHELAKSQRLPLLLIPLTFDSAFLLVCESSMSVCTGMLSNSPNSNVFGDDDAPPAKPSHYYNGRGRPLWTAWVRPARNESRREGKDDIYVVREDGKLMHLVFDKDLDVERHIVGDFNASCGAAFAYMNYVGSGDRSENGDLFVNGGDGCSGGTYLLQARASQKAREPIHNWTPAQDFVTTHDPSNSAVGGRVGSAKERIPKPDRVFACTGKGEGAAIMELRHGLEATIGLAAPFDDPVLQIWALPTLATHDDLDDALFLLSLGDTSSVLSISADATDMSLLSESATDLDLEHRTITVLAQTASVLQVTEKTIHIMGQDFVRKYETTQLTGMIGTNIDNAFVTKEVILFTTYLNGSVHLQVLDHRPLATNMDVDEAISVRTISSLSSSITSLLVAEIAHVNLAIVAEWYEGSASVAVQSIAGDTRHSIALPEVLDDYDTRLDAICSLSVVYCLERTFILLCGTRNGFLITLEISAETYGIVKQRIDRVGFTSVVLTTDEKAEGRCSFFVTCDSKLYHLQPSLFDKSGDSTKRWHNQPHNISRVWLSDAAQPYLLQPDITTFAQVRPNDASTRFDESILTLTGSQILVANLRLVPNVVPRKLKIKGTPSRLLFSPALNALVVAVSIDGNSALQFIDPDTGEDLSQPIDQATKLPVDFVDGLGHPNEKIWGLYEWKFTKDTATWNFIIVATSLGRVLIISIDNSSFETNGNSHNETRPKIKYYTRYRFRSHSTAPVYSVTGFSQGLLWCAGTNLYCDVLDQVKKKFVRVAEYNLPSPAISLQYRDGVIAALTQAHSLELLTLTLDDNGSSYFTRTHGDQLTRDALHHIGLELPSGDALHLVSDKSCSLVGLAPITGTKADTLEKVFDAELMHSVLRFRPATCRPTWDESWMKTRANGATQALSSGATNLPEVLGLSIMGSLTHFTVLDFKTWEYLRYMMDLAIRSPSVCEFTYEDSPIPDDSITDRKIRMQVDGDLLKTVLKGQHLEKLLLIGSDTPEAESIFDKFRALLRRYHDGKTGEDLTQEEYLDQAYADLNSFLRPVL